MRINDREKRLLDYALQFLAANVDEAVLDDLDGKNEEPAEDAEENKIAEEIHALGLESEIRSLARTIQGVDLVTRAKRTI